MSKEQPREFVIELTGWKFDYSFWVETNKRYQPSRPYFDFLNVDLSGAIIVPKAKRFAVAKLTMGHQDLYGVEIETKDPTRPSAMCTSRNRFSRAASRYRTA